MIKWFQNIWRLIRASFPKLVIYFLVCVLAITVLEYFSEAIDKMPHMQIVREQVEHGLILVVIFYFFFHLATMAGFINDVEETFINVLAANEKIFENLSTATKEKYVANSIKSALGNKFGSAVVDDIINPYLRRLVPHRMGFRYQIEALDGVPHFDGIGTRGGKLLAEAFSSTSQDKYLWLNQACEYMPESSAPNAKPKGTFLVALTFDKMDLQKLLTDNEIFFRDIIELEENLKEAVRKFTHEEADELVRRIFSLRISEIGNDTPVEYSVEFRTTSSMPYLLITTIQAPDAANLPGIAISFNSPQSREAPWFVTSLPQPCLDPVISFRRNSQMTRLEPVFFLSNFQEGKIRIDKTPTNARDPFEFNVAVDGWTFPTNGVMFTWRYRQPPPKATIPSQPTTP